jgi:HEPN domain-containing protein
MKSRHDYIQEWLRRVRSDLKVALHEMKRDDPASDVVCFHFQQAVEKMLKAWLVLNELEYKRSHNLEILLGACENADPSFERLRGIELLNPYAVDIRHPDDFYLPTREEMEEAARMTLEVRGFLKDKFLAAGVDAALLDVD